MWFDYALQVEWIKELQAWGGPQLASIMVYAHYLDSHAFYVLVIAGLWVVYRGRVAYLPTLAFAFNGVTNHILKHLSGQPRPYLIDPSVAGLRPIDAGFENGMPSGAAQTALLMFGILAYHQRSPAVLALAVAYPVFVGFTRVYLGMHFFTDIFGGWLVGGVLLLLYSKIARAYQSTDYGFTIAGAVITTVVVMMPMWLFPSEVAMRSSWAMVGVTWGYFIAQRLKLETLGGSWGKIAVQAVTTLGGALLLVLSFKDLSAIWFVLLGLWPTCLALVPQRVLKTML